MKKSDKENWISFKTRKAKCFFCKRIGAFKEEVEPNVYECKCGYKSVICPLCGLTDHLMSELAHHPLNQLCTKCKIIITPGEVTMTAM